jgi:hypothetical protein
LTERIGARYDPRMGAGIRSFRFDAVPSLNTLSRDLARRIGRRIRAKTCRYPWSDQYRGGSVWVHETEFRALSGCVTVMRSPADGQVTVSWEGAKDRPLAKALRECLKALGGKPE